MVGRPQTAWQRSGVFNRNTISLEGTSGPACESGWSATRPGHGRPLLTVGDPAQPMLRARRGMASEGDRGSDLSASASVRVQGEAGPGATTCLVGKLPKAARQHRRLS
jgi:hypothetical protein